MKKIIIILALLTGITAMASNIYYLDSVNGNDNNSGKSSDSPWKSFGKINSIVFQPGDKVLLKSNSVWNETFSPKGSGSADAPVSIDKYGDGNLPKIDCQGKHNYGIYLENIDCWEISNIEITNPSETEGDRIGIFVKCTGDKTYKHYHFKNLYIHDIMGKYTFEQAGKNTGGIGIIGEFDTRFDDILIENCKIGNLVRVGIFTNTTTGKYQEHGDRAITNLIVRGCEIFKCAGDGAIIRNALNPIIENNTAFENHNGPQDKVKHGVALWCRSTDDAVFQYNYVYDTLGDMDGQAFDSDLDTFGTIVRYNKTHDNKGGFMLVYGSSHDSVVYENESVNDGEVAGHVFYFSPWTSPRGSGEFYNNTISFTKDFESIIIDKAIETSNFHDNSLIAIGNTQLVQMNSEKELPPVINHNTYSGFNKEEVEKYDKNPVFITNN